jgi:hypothetical protein
MGESRNAYRILKGKPLGKQPFRRLRNGWEVDRTCVQSGKLSICQSAYTDLKLNEVS